MMFAITFLFMLTVVVLSGLTQVWRLTVRRQRLANQFMNDMKYYAAHSK